MKASAKNDTKSDIFYSSQKNQSEAGANLLALIDGLDTLIWSVNSSNFGFTAFNLAVKTRFYEDYGIEIEIGDRPCDIYPADIADQFCEFYKEALKEEGVKHLYKARVSERVYSLSFNRILFQDSEAGISVFGKDTTDYRKIKTELHQEMYLNKTLLQSLPHFCVVVTYEKKTRIVNNLLLEALGFAYEDVINKDYFELFVPVEEREYLNLKFERVRSGFVDIHAENHLITKDGKRILTEWRISPYYDENGRFMYIIGIGSDITERREMEIESLHYKTSLEELIKERNRELENTNILLIQEIEKQKEMENKVKLALEKEKEINEMKSRFISVASHEIKTPLTSIYSSAQLLEEYGRNWEPESYNSQIKRIKTQILHLNEMVEDILTLGRTDIGQTVLNPNKINLKQLCDIIIEDIKMLLLPTHELSYSIELKRDILNLDEKHIRSFVVNMLSNAVKYSPTGGKIEFKVKQRNEDLVFTIADNGIGITFEDQKELYLPFHRGRNVGDIKGTGLGLSFAKRAIDIQKGKIGLKSSVPGGTTFTVTIPIQKEPDGEIKRRIKETLSAKYKTEIMESREPLPGELAPKAIKILVIEDEKEIRNDIKYLLESEKFEVIAASSGEEGIIYFKQYKPDLVLCDIMMPGLNGYDVLKTINSLDDSVPVPFVFLSAKTGYRDFRAGMELGADDYIFKPYDANELIKTVHKCLAKFELLKSSTEAAISTKNANPENIFVRYRGRMISIRVEKILFISIEGQYSKIFVEGKKQYIMKKALKKWESILHPNTFTRIHRSTIVNIQKIKKVERISINSFKVYLVNSDQTLELSRRYFKNIKKYTLSN